MTGDHELVTSTAGLTPDGLLGYTKAIWAGLSAGLAALGVAVAQDGVSALEWVGIAAAVVLAAGGTFGFANKVKPVLVITPPAGGSTLLKPPP